MTQLNEHLTKKAENKSPNKSRKDSLAKMPRHCLISAVLLAVIALIAILAFVGGAESTYTLYKHKLLPWQTPELHQTGFYAIQARVNDLQSEIDQLNASLNGIAHARPTIIHAPQPTHSSIQASELQPKVEALYDRLAAFNIQVALAQASVFGQLAEAQDALDSAQSDLQRTGQSQALKLVLQTQSELRKIPPVNVNALLKKIDVLESALKGLRFRAPVTADDLKQAQAIEPEKQSNQVKAALDKSWHQIKGLLVVRHDNTIGQKLLTDSARVAALAAIRIQLQYARFYAIRDDGTLYQQALKTASALVGIYCQKDEASLAWQKSAYHLAQFPLGQRLAVLKSGLEQALALLKAPAKGVGQ